MATQSGKPSYTTPWDTTLAFVPHAANARKDTKMAAGKLSFAHWTTLALALASGIAIFSIPVYLPFFMRDAGLANPILNGVILAFMSVCSAFFAAFYGKARHHLSIGAAFRSALILLVIGCSILMVSSQIAAFVIAAMFLGCGMAWVAPNLMTAANLLSVDSNRGRIVGLVKGANLSGSFLAVLLLDPIYRFAGACATLGALALFATVLATIGTMPLKSLGKNTSG